MAFENLNPDRSPLLEAPNSKPVRATPAVAGLLQILGWLGLIGAGFVVALSLGGGGRIADLPSAVGLLVAGAVLLGLGKALELLASIDRRLSKLDNE